MLLRDLAQSVNYLFRDQVYVISRCDPVCQNDRGYTAKNLLTKTRLVMQILWKKIDPKFIYSINFQNLFLQLVLIEIWSYFMPQIAINPFPHPPP